MLTKGVLTARLCTSHTHANGDLLYIHLSVYVRCRCAGQKCWYLSLLSSGASRVMCSAPTCPPCENWGAFKQRPERMSGGNQRAGGCTENKPLVNASKIKKPIEDFREKELKTRCSHDSAGVYLPVVSSVFGSFDVSDSSAAWSGTRSLRGGGEGGGICLTHTGNTNSFRVTSHSVAEVYLSLCLTCLSSDVSASHLSVCLTYLPLSDLSV